MVAERDTARRQRSAWQEGFLELLPAIKNQVRYSFRKLPRRDRYEAIHEAVANALVAYARLVQLGKQSLAFATPLASYAVKQVCAGRRVGGRLNVQDVMSRYCQRRKGLKLQRLTEFDGRTGQWREIVVEDGRATPADVAATRIDFADWLRQLPRSKRNVAKLLATGEGTQAAAQRFRLSKARISQLRSELRMNWEKFQGERLPAAA